MPNDIKFYIAVLRSNECQCGKSKKEKMALCYQCFKELPSDMQKALYNGIRSGFEEAYESAIKWLN